MAPREANSRTTEDAAPGEELVSGVSDEVADEAYGHESWGPFDPADSDWNLVAWVKRQQTAVSRHWGRYLRPVEKEFIRQVKHADKAVTLALSKWEEVAEDDQTRDIFQAFLDDAFDELERASNNCRNRIIQQRKDAALERMEELDWPKRGPELNHEFRARVLAERDRLYAEGLAYEVDLTDELLDD